MSWFTAKTLSYLLPLALLAAALVAGVVMAYRLWHEMNEDIEPASKGDLMAEIEQAYREGEIDEAEMQRIRERMGRSRGSGAKKSYSIAPRVEAPALPEAASGESAAEARSEDSAASGELEG